MGWGLPEKGRSTAEEGRSRPEEAAGWQGRAGSVEGGAKRRRGGAGGVRDGRRRPWSCGAKAAAAGWGVGEEENKHEPTACCPKKGYNAPDKGVIHTTITPFRKALCPVPDNRPTAGLLPSPNRAKEDVQADVRVTGHNANDCGVIPLSITPL